MGCRLILSQDVPAGASGNETSRKDSTQESCLLGEGNPSRTGLKMSIRGRGKDVSQRGDSLARNVQ